MLSKVSQTQKMIPQQIKSSSSRNNLNRTVNKFDLTDIAIQRENTKLKPT